MPEQQKPNLNGFLKVIIDEYARQGITTMSPILHVAINDAISSLMQGFPQEKSKSDTQVQS